MSGKCPILSVVILMFALVLAASTHAGANAITPQPLRSSAGFAPRPDELAIVRVMNAVRANNGVGPMRVGRTLSRAARSHSVDMARRGYFAHGPFVQRLRSFGVRASYIGENLASGSQPLSAAAIVQMWLASPPHRQNLLDRGFTKIGVGTAGGNTRMVTADFAG